MTYLVYNEGYKLVYEHKGKQTGNKYQFRKKFATSIDERDLEYFLSLMARDIPWCPNKPKTIQPFIEAEDYCTSQNINYEEFLADYIWK